MNTFTYAENDDGVRLTLYQSGFDPSLNHLVGLLTLKIVIQRISLSVYDLVKSLVKLYALDGS